MNERSAHSIHTLCRICLNTLENDAAYGLFMVPGLAKKLCICTSLSVEQHDGFPENICISCYNKLDDLHCFQRMCVDSVQKFNEMVANNCFVCNTPPMNCVNVLNVAAHDTDIAAVEEDDCNFDPLLNTKVEIVEDEDHLLDMIENVDKELEDEDKNSSIHSESATDDEDMDFEVNSSESDEGMPLSRLYSNTRAKAKQKAKRNTIKGETDDSSSSDSSDEDDSDDDDDNDDGPNKGTTKPKRKRIPAAERHRHTLIECHVCHQKFKKAYRYEEHMKHHNDLLPFQCEVESCKKGFTTNGGLRLHVEHAHPELVKAYPCTVEGCDKTFTRTTKLTNHLKREHNIIKPKIKRFPCSECDKVFQCPTALKKHMYKHTGEELPYACEICARRFFIQCELRDHLLRHARVKNFVCPHCGVGKYTQSELNKHILTHTRVKQFHCNQCNHSSHNKQALANHINVVHLKIKKYACQLCGKTFGKSSGLRVHEARHSMQKAYPCTVCGFSYATKQSLVKHLQGHENYERPVIKTKPKSEKPTAKPKTTIKRERIRPPKEKKPKPVPPPKPYNSPNRLEHVDRAELAGTVVNPIPFVSIELTKINDQFICPACNRGFNHKNNLKMHYRNMHEMIKDQACRFCPKRFAKVHTLRNHELIHTGEKPFECTICGKYFRQKLNLQTHLKIHNKPPKPPKQPKETKKRESKNVSLNFEDCKDLAAESAAATAALLAQEIEENERKRKAEAELQRIQEAAYEQIRQLNELQQQQPSEKKTYDNFFEEKAKAEGISPDVFKIDHV
ncbi:zinc finger protein 16 [Drosophila busckii]|nr:zinc finger protein 16 [Drosophila busckii]